MRRIEAATRIKLAEVKQDVAKAKVRVREEYERLEDLKAELDVSSSILHLGFREYERVKRQVEHLREREHLGKETGQELKKACRAVVATYLDELEHPEVHIGAVAPLDSEEE